jgi:hypothetical protein
MVHDWEVDQLVDLFHTTHTVKNGGDIEMTVYLDNETDPVSLVLD